MNPLAILLFVLAFLTYIAAVGIASDLHGSDAAGNGMAQGFGFLATLVLWVVLGCLSLLAGLRSRAPGWLRISVALAAVAGAASDLAAFNLLADNFYHAKWPMAIVVVLPILAALLAAWTLFGAARGVAAALLIVVAIVAILPWPATVYRGNHRESDLAAWAAAAPERERQQNEREWARLRALTTNSPLSDWLEFAGRPEFRDAAFDGIRKSPRRQAEVEEMFRTGFTYVLMYVPDMDITMSPVVCAGSKRRLAEITRDLRRNPNDTGPIYFHDSQDIWLYRDGLAWIVSHGCDCADEIKELENVARQYEDTPDRQKFLDFLAELRRSRPSP